MTALTRRQALALAATAPVAAVLPAASNAILLIPGYAVLPDLFEADRAFWAAVRLQASRNTKRQLIAMVRARDRMRAAQARTAPTEV